MVKPHGFCLHCNARGPITWDLLCERCDAERQRAPKPMVLVDPIDGEPLPPELHFLGGVLVPRKPSSGKKCPK